MGATLVDGKWKYKDAPVTLIFIIRNDSDGTRLPIGEYVAAQLEALGFTVDRQYEDRLRSLPHLDRLRPLRWSMAPVHRCLVLHRTRPRPEQHLPGNVPGLQRSGYPCFPCTMYPIPNSRNLATNWLPSQTSRTVEERHEMMARALELSLQDSLQVFLIDGKSFIPYVSNVVATADLAAGVEGAQIWPFTLRFADKEGGTVRWATQDLFR